jgi:hypothetical protein
LRKRAIAAALMVIGASLIWTTAALAGPTPLTVRIEGKEKTLFEGPILTEGHEIQSLSDTQTRPCDATNNHAHPEAMPTPTAAAVDAMELSGQAWDGNWFDGYDDYYLTQFGNDHEDLNAGQYWGVLANGVFTPVGGCQWGDRAGDEVLWAYDAFSGRRFLWLAASGDPTVAPRTPLPTAYVEVGQPLGLLVESYEGGGSPAERAAGITVAPVTTDPVDGDQTVDVGDAEAVVTNGEGGAEITFSTPGWHRIKAQKEAGFIRSNRIDVCVEPEGGGGCGPMPADAALRTPQRYLPPEPEGGGEEPPKGGEEPPKGGGETPKGGGETPKGGGETGGGEKEPAGGKDDPTPVAEAPKSDPPAASPAPAMPLSNAFSLSRAVGDTKSGTSTLAVTVPGAGHLSLAGKKVVGTAVDTVAAGTVELTIRPTKSQRRTLHRRGKLRVGLKVSFTPTGGTTSTAWRSVVLTSKG